MTPWRAPGAWRWRSGALRIAAACAQEPPTPSDVDGLARDGVARRRPRRHRGRPHRPRHEGLGRRRASHPVRRRAASAGRSRPRRPRRHDGRLAGGRLPAAARRPLSAGRPEPAVLVELRHLALLDGRHAHRAAEPVRAAQVELARLLRRGQLPVQAPQRRLAPGRHPVGVLVDALPRRRWHQAVEDAEHRLEPRHRRHHREHQQRLEAQALRATEDRQAHDRPGRFRRLLGAVGRAKLPSICTD